MASSPLDPGNLSGQNDRIVNRGHGTRALGPSDSSDSGSDVAGAGAGVGDAELDSDSDRFGTGERSSAGSDVPESSDIVPDRIERVEAADEDEDEGG